ncbi:hypothetical protein TNIN_384531 [Trichonephila inaurata madagascariensis]|uniref:Uncharacterized protein n=1 Tax=Trichonephila inaurata madagascariensis TaxID=2747483 RepID=A0A8X6XQK7_9ARAC|nr:hypothetical protein TNIN_384531 [Trichonephila inaurata madagascariensis]
MFEGGCRLERWIIVQDGFGRFPECGALGSRQLTDHKETRWDCTATSFSRIRQNPHFMKAGSSQVMAGAITTSQRQSGKMQWKPANTSPKVQSRKSAGKVFSLSFSDAQGPLLVEFPFEHRKALTRLYCETLGTPTQVHQEQKTVAAHGGCGSAP